MVSTELTQQLIDRSRPRWRFPGGRLSLLLVFSVLLGVALADPAAFHLSPILAGLAPVVLLLSLIFLARMGIGRQQRRARRWSRASEAVLVEDWPAARERLCGLLSKPVANTIVRAQGLLSLAAVADHYHQYQSSQLLYEQVLKDASGQPAQLHAAAVGMAAAMLRNDELTGAVQLIDQLSRQSWPRPWKAHVELVRLFREAVMGQYDDIVASAKPRQELFRQCLAVRSGYGYGLMALGYHRRGLVEDAARLWQDATLLVAPHKLLDRFPMLSELTTHYPACEVPL